MVQLRKATFSKEVIYAIFSTLSMTLRMGITGSTTAIAKAIFGRDDANLSDIGNALVQFGGGRADMVGLSSAMFVLDELGRNVVGLFPQAVGSFHQRLELLKRSIGESEMADEIALMLMTIMIKELNQQTEAALRQGL